MQSGRVVQLARRLSAGDTCLKNNVTINKFCRDCYSHKEGNLADSRKFYRFYSSSTFGSDSKLISTLTQNKLIFRAMTSTPVNDKELVSGAEHYRFTNRLSKEKSPYLLQHAHNPVDWYPWGDEAIQKAKKENKLIFLSVGYSTCHWCHVMEHESFENETVARIMNEHFVNVKVDREERPDIDKIYMTFIQATSARGGWPMSVFLTPDLNPVTGGTYFPVEDRWGRPGFKTILIDLAKKWKQQQLDFMTSGEHILEVLKKVTEMTMESTEENPHLPSEECWTQCVKKYVRSFDKQFGGFGGAPKFPQISNLNFLFHIYSRSKESNEGKQCLEMCLHTLKKMACGGIHDHVSNGFARYSVDARWHVPHFEKMLYDQSQLCMSYVDAYIVTKDNFYLSIVRDIITYVCRDLSNPCGGFYSAEDADSLPTFSSTKKKEGAFCVWTYEEIKKLLDGKTITADKSKNNVPVSYTEIFCYHFNVLEGGNTDTTQDRDEELLNQNVLIILGSAEETAEKFGMSVQDLTSVLDECKEILYNERQKRPRPHLDSKMLCSWNGLMLGALAKAGQAVGDMSYIERAEKAAHFIRKYLYLEDKGLLLRSCYRGHNDSVEQIENPITGFLDDYAFLIKGLLELYEATLNHDWLDWASQLQDKQDELFWDTTNHAYFTSPEGATSVILRLKEDVDGAEPSGNSVSVHNLLRLSALGGGIPNDRRQKAEETLLVFSSHMSHSPMALPEMVSALMFYMDSPTQIFIAGKRDDPRTQDLLSVVRCRLLPGRVLALIEPEQTTEKSSSSSVRSGNPVLKKIRPIKGSPAAYVCRHHACSLPVTDPKKLEALLE